MAAPAEEFYLPYKWRPRRYQLKSWIAWEKGIKREILIWHRRAGKDDVAMHKIAVAAHPSPEKPMGNARVANYWHCLPAYEQARKAIWEAVNPHTGRRRIDEAFPPVIRKRTDNSSMVIEFQSGSTYRIVGSDNPDSLVGAAPFGIVFSEWAISNPSVWPYLAPILNENGGWASFITTPRGRNHAWAMYNAAADDPAWFRERLTVDDTQVISAMQIEEDRRTYVAMFGEEAADALIQQEYWCSFEAAILGAYYGKLMLEAEQSGRIALVAPVPDAPVHTAWDLGVDDATAIWFWQAVPGKAGTGEIRLVDYVEGHGYAVPYYAKLVKDRARQRGYVRGFDWVPHDARQREWGSYNPNMAEDDPNFGLAKQRIEVMAECGLKPRKVRDHTLVDGISAVRQVLPRARFDAKRCAAGLEALRQYQTEWDDEKKVFKKTPLHNWCFTGDTEVLTRYGMQQIMNLPATGEVLTSCGWNVYQNPRITRRNALLVGVEFEDGLTVRCTPDHLFLTDRGWKSAECLTKGTPIQSTLIHSLNILMEASIDCGRKNDTSPEVARHSIAPHGRWHLGQFLKDVISTTATITRSTMFSQIWNAYLWESIFRSLGTMELLRAESTFSRLTLASGPQHGIDQRPDCYGIEETRRGLRTGPSGSASHVSVLSAEPSFNVFSGKVVTSRSFAPNRANLLRIANVFRLREREDVWCLTVPGIENFSLSNGAIVHNCSHGADAMRYLAMAYREVHLAAPPPEDRMLTVAVPGEYHPASQVTLEDLWGMKRVRSRRI